jgi:hypothetical protein
MMFASEIPTPHRANDTTVASPLVERAAMASRIEADRSVKINTDATILPLSLSMLTGIYRSREKRVPR